MSDDLEWLRRGKIVACVAESLQYSPEKTKRNNGGRQSEIKPSTSYILVVQIKVLLRYVVQEVQYRSVYWEKSR